MIRRMADTARPLIRALEAVAPVSDLLLRLWVAKIFFQSKSPGLSMAPASFARL